LPLRLLFGSVRGASPFRGLPLLCSGRSNQVSFAFE